MVNAIGRLQQEELDVVRPRDKVRQKTKHYEATGAHHHGPGARKKKKGKKKEITLKHNLHCLVFKNITKHKLSSRAPCPVQIKQNETCENCTIEGKV